LRPQAIWRWFRKRRWSCHRLPRRCSCSACTCRFTATRPLRCPTTTRKRAAQAASLRIEISTHMVRCLVLLRCSLKVGRRRWREAGRAGCWQALGTNWRREADLLQGTSLPGPKCRGGRRREVCAAHTAEVTECRDAWKPRPSTRSRMEAAASSKQVAREGREVGGEDKK
jgi:hypothetical protein